MNFSENTNLLPGGQSASPSKLKELDNKIDDLAQTVTSVADSVADLADEVTTAELNATDANVTNAVIDNATVGTETATTVNATTANADNLNATDADITNLTADDVEANSVDADNGYFGSVNAQSFTGQGVNITGDITASAKVQGKTVQATEKVVTPALESTTTELKGKTTVRGDVYFPETGDKIYGEYLEIEADKVKADIEADTVNATSVTAGTVTATSVAAQGLLVTDNSRFVGRLETREIMPDPGNTLNVTTTNLFADTANANTVEVNSLTTETPTGSSQLVGYDANGKLIPVNAGLDPSNYWELVPDDQTSIQPKDEKNVKLSSLESEHIETPDIYVEGSFVVNGLTTFQGKILQLDSSGGNTLKDTEVDGTLTVNGDIIQNGSAYETHAEKVYSKNDLIITRDGAVSGLPTGQYTGIQAEKYDGTNDGQLVFDKDGEARVGDVGDTEPLMTRDELADMTDGSLLKWDGTNKKAVCAQSADIIPSDASTSNKLATKDYVSTALAEKQDTLTFDDAPTSGSNNPVKSGGIYTALAGYMPTKVFNNPNGITQYVKIECIDTFGGILLSFSFTSMYFISSAGVINLTDSDYGLSGVAISTDKKIIWLRITGYRNYTITNLGKWASITISDATTTAPSGFTFTTDLKQVAVKSDLTSYTKQVVVDDITATGPNTLAELLSLATAQMNAEQPYVCKLRGRGTGLYVGNIMTYQKSATPNYAMAQIIQHNGTMYKCNCVNGTWTITTV